MQIYTYIILASFLLIGCASKGLDKTDGWSAKKLYENARSELNVGNYETAVSVYQKLSSRFPFGKYAQQGSLDIAYAHWKNGDSGIALASLDRYNKLYPNQGGSDYALYLRGLINFNENQTLFSSITGEDMAERDAEAGRIAFASFKQLVNNFPDTPYKEDAIKRMRFLRNVLAENEAHVARFYMRRKAYIASLNRSKVILSQYHGTPAVEEALALMVNIYGVLGLQDLSNDSLRVLKLNYPQSPYLEYEYNPKERGGLPKSIRRKTNTTWNEFDFIKSLKGIVPKGLIED